MGILVLVGALAIDSAAIETASGEEVQIDKPGRWIGRVDEASGRFGWPGSGFEIVFTGKNLSVTLEDSGMNSLMVEIGGQARRIDLQEGRHVYPLAEGLSDGRHSVRVSRRTEGLFGETRFVAASSDGKLAPTEPMSRSIVVIGDSISAGYGVEGMVRTCSFSPDTENQYLTYAAAAARALGADVTTLAVSGRGLVRNYDDSTSETMSIIYRRKVPTDPTLGDTAFLHQFDAVIVHLGTNDFSNGGRPDRFIDAYLDLLSEVRQINPNAVILLAGGPMLGGDDARAFRGAIEKVVRNFEREDSKGAEILQFDEAADEYGCDWHPNIETHHEMAEQLVAALRTRLGW